MTDSEPSLLLRGSIAATTSYLIWGLLPIYWRVLEQVAPYQILAHRVVWSLILTACLLVARHQISHFAALFADRRVVLHSVLCGALLGANWLIYIWAVNSEQIIEASLGYYINPLVTVSFAVLILKERLRSGQLAALFLALLGVAYLTFVYGRFPWIALSLAMSFAIYGLMHKITAVRPIDGLFLETLVCLPPALVLLVASEITQQGAFLHSGTTTSVLLVLTGVVTTVPLLCFAYAAHIIPLSTLGILQYLSPTINLLLGIFLYHEEFSWSRATGFLLIWGALAIYLVEGIVTRRKVKRRVFTI